METKLLKPEFYSLADYHKDKYPENILSKIDAFSLCTADVRNNQMDLFHQKVLSKTDPHVYIKDKYSGKAKQMLMLASNNYLGLSTRPEIIEAQIKAIEKYGTSTTSAPHFSGMTDLHRELEIKIAQFKGYEDCVLFTTGYCANIGAVTALAGKSDTIILDKLNHASIIDGAVLSGAALSVFPHKNLHVLDKKLSTVNNYSSTLVITDGIFSMEGDIFPLDELYALKQERGFTLMVDDAHATGVIGKKGKGTASYFNLSGKMDLEVGTLSKSLGGNGGFVVSDAKTIDYIRFYARSYIFSSAMPAATAAGVIKALEILEKEGDELSRKVQLNASYLRSKLIKKGFTVTGDKIVPIIPVIVGNDWLLMTIHKELHENHIFTNAVPYPAVPKKESRLRLSVMATHRLEDLDMAIDILEKIFKKYNLI